MIILFFFGFWKILLLVFFHFITDFQYLKTVIIVFFNFLFYIGV